MKHLTYLISIVLFYSCTTEIEVEIPDAEPLKVVEGNIENGEVAKVLLTRSTDFFDPLDTNTLLNIIVTDATVKVKEYQNGNLIAEENLSLEVDFDFFPPLVYKGSSIIGVVGNRYDLEIISEGDTITGSTRILPPVALDSLWFELEPGLDSLGPIKFILSDPDTLGNRYRFFAKRLNRDSAFIPISGDLREDAIINGSSFESFIYRGFSEIDEADSTGTEVGYFRMGDTIDVKTAQLDYEHFRFWLSVANNGGDSPFSSPSNLIENVKGGLGVWGSYGSSIQRVIAQP